MTCRKLIPYIPRVPTGSNYIEELYELQKIKEEDEDLDEECEFLKIQRRRRGSGTVSNHRYFRNKNIQRLVGNFGRRRGRRVLLRL